MPLLPPIGAEIPCSMLAINAKLEFKGKTLELDFRGGIKQRIDVNPNDPINSVKLRTVGFRVSAQLDDGMTVSIEQNDVDVDPQSSLRTTQSFPKFEQRDVLTFTAVFEQKSGDEPVILTTKNPMVLVRAAHPVPAQGRPLPARSPGRVDRPRKPGHRRRPPAVLPLQAGRPVAPATHGQRLGPGTHPRRRGWMPGPRHRAGPMLRG